MICAISGETPKEPVVSPRSGAIFEKAHIVNYISTSGKDPINDEPLSVDDLVPIKSSTSFIAPPNPSNLTSIPSLLSAFQNEWDSLALEVFTLRKHLQKAREELSSALYHQDAATRVAARAIKERDEARNALQELVGSIGAGNIEEESPSSGNLIPVEEINESRNELFQLHKSQKPKFLVSPNQSICITFIKNHVQPFKKTSSVHLESNEKRIMIGSPTGTFAIYPFNKSGKDELVKISHKGIVTALTYVSYKGDLLPIAAFSDVILLGDNITSFKHDHKNIIKMLSHPKLKHLFLILSKHSWSLNDVNKAVIYRSTDFESEFTTGDIHFDGALFGVGDLSGNITIFDLSTSNSVFQQSAKYTYVKEVKFALNGYWLFVSSYSSDGAACLEIFDLRKNTVVHTIGFENELVDFIIDPSSTLLITYDRSNKLKVHRFIKKEKNWLENNSEILMNNSKSTITKLELLTAVEDSEFINDNIIRLISIAENSSVLEYQISCQ